MDCLRCVAEPTNPFDFTQSSVDIELDRSLSVVRYSLTYQSRAQQDTKNVSFAFPQDDSSALFEFEATVNDRVIQCEVRDKQEARETFEKAVEAGFSAAMAGESDSTSDLFTCYLGNVRAGSAVLIHMSSLVELDEEEPGLCKLTLMRRLVPRYTPGTAVAKAPLTQSGAAEASWLHGQLEIRCSLPEKPALVTVECAQAAIEWLEAGQKFRLAGADASGSSDIEIRLRYAEPRGPLPELLVSRQAAEASPGGSSVFRGSVLACELMLGDQVLAQQKQQQPDAKEFVLIVDRSGSMSGANIKSAREALLLFLKSLPSDCRFNVISFGSSFQPLFPSAEPYTEVSLQAALSLQSGMEADMGGTEILEPIRWLFEQPSQCPKRSVVLITDGEVSNVQEVKDLVQAHCGSGSSCRVHAVGIGHGASTALVKGVARVGRGRAEFVRDNDAGQLRRTVVGLLKADRLDGIEEFELQIAHSGQPLTFRTVPESILGLPSALHLRLFALLDSDPASTTDLTVRAVLNVGGRRVELDCGAGGVRQSTAGSSLYKLAAARHLIKEWSDGNADGGRTEEIKALSKATNLSSPYTTFIGVDRTEKSKTAPSVPLFESGTATELPPIVFYDQASHFRPYPMAMMAMACAPVAMACSQGMPRLARRAAPQHVYMATDGIPRAHAAAAPLELMDCDMVDSGQGGFGGGGYDYKVLSAVPPPPPPPPAPTTDTERTLFIAQLQAFDGHWSPGSELLAVLGVTGERLKASMPAGLSEEAWTTALVLAYLSARLSRFRAEWELMAEKSAGYLGRQCVSCGRTADEVLALARSEVGGN